MPRMCGTNPKDLVCFPPHLPSALNPLLCPLCWKFLPLHTAPLALFFSPLSSSSWSSAVLVPLWLIASPSLSLLCLPPAAYTLIIPSHPGGDFNFCCTSPFPVLVFYNLLSSCACTKVHLHLCSKGHDLDLGRAAVTCFQCWTQGDQVVYKMLSDVSGNPAHYTLQC